MDSSSAPFVTWKRCVGQLFLMVELCRDLSCILFYYDRYWPFSFFYTPRPPAQHPPPIIHRDCVLFIAFVRENESPGRSILNVGTPSRCFSSPPCWTSVVHFFFSFIWRVSLAPPVSCCTFSLCQVVGVLPNNVLGRLVLWGGDISKHMLYTCTHHGVASQFVSPFLFSCLAFHNKKKLPCCHFAAFFLSILDFKWNDTNQRSPRSLFPLAFSLALDTTPAGHDGRRLNKSNIYSALFWSLCGNSSRAHCSIYRVYCVCVCVL